MAFQNLDIEKVIAPLQFRHLVTTEDLPDAVVRHLQTGATNINLKKGAVVFRQGTLAQGVYFLIQGKVKSYSVNFEGQCRIAHIYSEGDILGYCPLFTNGIHMATLEALEPCVLQFVPSEAFVGMLGDSPSFTRMMLQAVSREFAAWSNFQMAFDTRPVRTRLALALMILHEKYRKPGNSTAVIYFTRTDLAAYVGASLETIVRTLSEFRAQGLVHVRGRRIMINDFEKLIALGQKNSNPLSQSGLA